MTKKFLKITLIIGLFTLLIAIRYFESYFYDPLQSFFKQAYLHQKLPQINTVKLFGNIFMRYTLNSLISIFLIWVVFKNKGFIIFSSIFYLIVFVILIIILYILLQTSSSQYYLPIFYVRRFLIQPVFILLLLPAFYYQQIQNK
jgi:exosortase F-associated protein